MVLCAGLGTRLRPLTNTWPKPALPLLGQPLLRYALAILQRAGVTEVGVNTFHLPGVMEAVAREECAGLGLGLEVSREAGELLGTGGGIRGLRAFLARGPAVVLNGDVLFNLDLAPVLRAHVESGADASMVLLPMPEGQKYNAVEVDAQGQVRRIAGKGPGGERLTPWHFTGVHVISPRVFEFMAPTGPEDINHDVYPRLLAAGGRVRAHVVDATRLAWSDLGTPARYAATHQQLLFGQVDVAPFGDADPFRGAVKGPGNFHAQPGARLGDVRVSGPAWFGAGCVLGAGVRIGAGVSVGQGAHVGAGASLNRVAVLPGAEVPPNMLVEDAIVAPGGIIVPTVEAPSC